MRKARLFAPFGPLAGLDRTVDAPVTLGSGSDNGVVVPGRTISSRHARLEPDAESGDWLLEDLGSTNGTELDGMRVVGPERLDDLHVIDLAGAATLFFLVEAAGDQAAAPPKPTLPVDRPEERLAGTRRVLATPVAPPPPSPAPAAPAKSVQTARDKATLEARRELYLEVRARGKLLRRYALKQGRNLVGRSVLADVRLERDDMSREHAMIEVTGGIVTIEDLGSTNGTFVDGKAADQALPISESSDVRFGGVRAKLSVSLLD